MQANPADTQAYTLLGVADTFAGDTAGAVAAFNKSGPVPDQYKTLAMQSYEKYAGDAFDAKQYPKRSRPRRTPSIEPAEPARILRARKRLHRTTERCRGDRRSAEGAHDRHGPKSDAKTMASIAYSLAIAQLDAGQYGEAATAMREVAAVDGPRSAQLDKYAYAAVNNTAIALANRARSPTR